MSENHKPPALPRITIRLEHERDGRSIAYLKTIPAEVLTLLKPSGWPDAVRARTADLIVEAKIKEQPDG